MPVLLIAKPNEKYQWKNNFAGITLQACLINGNTIFQELQKEKVFELQNDLVKQLFPKDLPANECPFLIDENIEFYSLILKKEKEKPKRTKFTFNPKRTKR
jgi:hypothetical protein